MTSAASRGALTRTLTVIGVVSVLNGCAGRPAADTGPTVDPCTAGDDVGERDIRFGLEPRAAADFVAAQLYDTLVRVDCTGLVQPGLASSWSDSAGIAWRFELQRGRTFTDGRPVDAQAVLRSWTAPMRSIATSFAALSADGPHVLHVRLHEPARVQLFAHPELSVTGDDADSIPSGTTAWRVASARPPRLESVTGRTLTPLLHEDLRTALNDAAHGLLTDDPAILAYASTRAEYRASPLPWTRTYVIATAAADTEPRLPAEVSATLARDVVRGEVRAAQPPFWWEDATCGTPGLRFANPQSRDVVYPRGDRAAQALAERIAALAWPVAAAPAWLRDLLPAGYGAAGAPRVSGLDEDALLTAVRARLPLVVIAPIPLMFERMCMSDAAESVPRALLTSGWRLTPAVDARAVLLHRPGLGRVTVDAFGRVRIESR